MNYRLGIDLGSTSLGWCIIKLNNNEPDEIAAIGVRIFPDGREDKTKKPLSVSRRENRSARKRRDRHIKRAKELMNQLIRNGLMPEQAYEREQLRQENPLSLRVKALDEQISLYELGRALFHINQRRGFKSNRKQDMKNKERGVIEQGINKLKEKSAQLNARTLGEYLFITSDSGKNTIRAKPIASGSKNTYDIYPERSMYEGEFDKIWEKQREYYPNILTCQLKDEIKNKIIFYQRNLKPQPVGKCAFEDEERMPAALPLSQKLRILQEINNLTFTTNYGEEIKLSEIQRIKLKEILLKPEIKTKKGEFTFTKIKKELKIDSAYKFNLESEKREGLQINITAKSMSEDSCFGDKWFKLKDDDQNKIIEKLLSDDDEQTIVKWLEDNYGLNPEPALNVSRAGLPDGYGSLGKTASLKIIPYLEKGLKYHQACEKAGYHHSDIMDGEVLEELPYYGEALPHRVIGGTKSLEDKPGDKSPGAQYEKYWGKINNPSVHIALNQLRKFINELIKVYGKPADIAIELARELKMGRKQLKELEKQQTDNQKQNEEADRYIESAGYTKTPENRLKYKLWKELSKNIEQRCCVFTGKAISNTILFSDEIEIEHILPFSKTYDDSQSNKTLAFREANRRKGNRSPFDAFGNDDQQYNEIVGRANNLPANKRWRFLQNAMDKFKDENEVIARQLNDTKYMSKTAMEYLQRLYGKEKKIRCSPGKLTALLRNKWGLNLHNVLSGGANLKDRSDHRHHALDAIVVACASREILRKVSSAKNDSIRERIIESMPEPMPEFQSKQRQKLKTLLESMVISYKPDHKGVEEAIKHNSTVGPLHEKTAYGEVSPTKAEAYGIKVKNEGIMLSTRKELSALEKKNIKDIADRKIREELIALTSNTDDKTEIKNILIKYGNENNINRVKCFFYKNNVIGIKNKEGKIYKYFEPGGNYRADIYCPKRKECDGKCAQCAFKAKGVWECEIITNFDAHRKGFTPKWRKGHPYAKLMMKLFINDMVAYEENGVTQIRRVKKMTSGYVYLRDHKISKEEGDKLSWEASAKQLHIKNARKIAVDILGKVKGLMGRKDVNN